MEDLEKLIKMVWASEGKVPVLVGEPGCGKTTFVNSMAEKDEAFLKVINLSAFEAVDMNGMPFLNDGKLMFSDPFYLTEIMNYLEKNPDGVVYVFLDEYSNAPTDVRNTLLEPLLHNILQTGKKIPRNVKFILAMNTAKDLEGFVDFSNAMKDRMFMIPFKTDPVEWRKMFKNNFGKPQSDREKSIRKELSKFLETNPQLLEGRKPVSASAYGITDEAEATTVEYTTPNRRNWDNLARLMAQTQNDEELKPLRKTMFIGMVGLECWRNYKEYLGTKSKPLSEYKWDGEPDEISQQVARLKAEKDVDKKVAYYERAYEFCANKEIVASILPDVLASAIGKHGLEYQKKYPKFYEIYKKIGA